jgi:outer membrane lipoprotein-sorting protein
MASQSGRRSFVRAGLAAVLAVAAGHVPAPRASDLFDEIHRRGAPLEARLQSVTASFTETTSSTLLAKPIVTRGRVIAQRPANVLLMYDAPDARVVRIVDGQLTIDWPARAMHESKDVRTGLQRATRLFIGKSPDDLRKHFDITASVDTQRAGTWRVTFVPKRRQLREGLDRLHLWIDQQSLLLQALEMEIPGGDIKRMEFTDVVINPALGPDTFGAAPRR